MCMQYTIICITWNYFKRLYSNVDRILYNSNEIINRRESHDFIDDRPADLIAYQCVLY